MKITILIVVMTLAGCGDPATYLDACEKHWECETGFEGSMCINAFKDLRPKAGCWDAMVEGNCTELLAGEAAPDCWDTCEVSGVYTCTDGIETQCASSWGLNSGPWAVLIECSHGCDGDKCAVLGD